MSDKIQTIDFHDPNAGKNLVNSLHNTGFAILHNHPIDYNLINNVYKEWEAFFSSEEKYSFTFNPKTQDGYFPYRSENAKGYSAKDLKEFYNFYEWGKYPNNIIGKTKRLYYELLDIGQILLTWINAKSPKMVLINSSVSLPEMIENSRMNLMRIIHYPPLNSDVTDGAIRAAAHGDINLITVLPAASQPGLQVQTKEDEWLDVKCNPGWLVINTGDMLQECSNGYYPSTIHRVVNPKTNNSHLSRYSIPLFIHPRDEVILSKRYSAKKYLDERLMEIGLKT
jgi:isopenicillin N synthase-like dioxygenase|tara:strand:+ start:52 stop:897 length:846 start_codon:yes stop_codon:yes gene_type:complete